ncbi:MAG: hypothetical protein A2751_05555 [Candidatus Doudnabacteria bacterium RIFCSPHIGHO2_01_FULL_46_14]|uniref:CYTH domain-containing protein n=1 Tax=Candidatus Doudnabacteria bacterium RIFCSPHIGHO2_01_FULL_46_14 TaxID=1817824 RepID=A0A1F5NNE4_9BACT|nr:MAG: hypothetical protein A2751_05555 [Candidatus Doudnabacteria bacterium RIFCSPHIGHO2_01_FULL_46_14]
MNEIEVKILEIDVKDVQKKLAALGAKKIFDGEVSWTGFDFPDGKLGKGEMLRLRRVGDRAELTHKKLLSTTGAKISEELQTEVGDYESTKKILEAVGFREKRGYPLNKHRISYSLKDLRFEIDTFSDFPTYLEIEGPSQETINEHVEKLGFSIEQTKPWGAREVFDHYRHPEL